MKKQILILLIILPGIAGFLSGQKAGILHLADSLSKASRYNASNEVLHQFIRDNPKRLYDLSTAYFLMSYNFLQLGDYESSIVSNGESLHLRERLRTDDLAENYMRLGAVQLVQGDYERAMHNFFKARELPYESPRLFSMINGYLATAFLEMGEYERANKAYLQSLEILKIDLGESHPDVSAIYYNIGQVFLREGRPSLAESALFQSLGLERQRSEPSVMLGLVQNALGDAARLDGRVADALDYYRQALSVFQKLFGERHRETARVYLNMARVQITGGDLSAARESIRLAVMSLCPASDEGLTLDRLLLANAMELRAEAALAEFEKTKQISDLESALAAAREGIALVEQQLNFQGASAARFRLTENQTGLFEKGILAAFQLYEQSRDFQYAAAVFEMMERAKRMDIRANNVQMIQTSNLYPELKAKETIARVALTEAEIEFARQPDDGEVQTRVVRERDNFLKLIREVEGLDPGYFNLRYGPSLISLEEAQAGIGPTTALASYFLGKEQYYILAFTAEEVRPVRLPNGFSVDLKKESGRSPEIDQAVDGFIHAVKNTEADKFVSFSSDLYGKLIDPIADILKNKDHLIIIPHGKLHNVPFEALISRAPKKIAYRNLDYLLHQYIVSYHYSATLSFEERRLEGILENSLLAVAPVFSDPEGSMIWSEGYVFDTTYQHGESLRSAVVADGSRFQPIKHTESEVASITALFNKKGKSTVVFLFDRATEEHFKEAAPLSRILHLATHSFIDEANPRLSGIAFTQPNEMEVGGDGILYAPEIASLNLEGVDLVVLSHFESGAWRSGPREGAFSLSHAFLNAGAGRVIHSLWKVYAPYANRLMLPFYEAVLEGQNYDKALQAAKIKMTRNNETADPGIWSGFLLVE